MKCIKKLVALTLAAVLALAMLTACGGGGVQVDLQKSREILGVVNERRTAGGKSELALSEEASLLLGDLARVSATSGGGNLEETTYKNTRAKVFDLAIDGKKVSRVDAYIFYHTPVSDVKNVVERNPQWFIHDEESDANYVAIAAYEGMNESSSACVVFVITAN